jgi:hypothetical protein
MVSTGAFYDEMLTGEQVSVLTNFVPEVIFQKLPHVIEIVLQNGV